MENINIVINKTTRMIKTISKRVLGNDGENLQENFIFSFEDEFVDGTGRLEVTMPDDTSYYYMLTKEDETYQLPVKSIMTKSGRIYMQLVVTEGTNENEIPIFKSRTFYVTVNDSINAEIEEPEGYSQWIDIANAKLNVIDSAVASANNAVERVDSALEDLNQANEEAREIIDNFEDNVENYTSSFNQNATQKTNTFNSNASTKLEEYNTNANSKVSSYNSNAESKLNTYDSNATEKLSAFNSNAISKLNEYNTNATEKLTAYNENAQNKTDEFNENAETIQKDVTKLKHRVSDLESNQPTYTATGTEIHVEDAHETEVVEDKMSKVSSQDGEPSPENPVEIQTVKGYRNYFNTLDIGSVDGGVTYNIIDNNNVDITYNSSSSSYVKVKFLIKDLEKNTNYIFKSSFSNSNLSVNRLWLAIRNSQDTTSIYNARYLSGNVVSFNTGDNTSILIGLYCVGEDSVTTNTSSWRNIELTEGTEEKPYVPYGSNYVYKKIIGKNLFDGEIELGNINPANGELANNNSRTRSKNFIKVKPNTTYYFKHTTGDIRWIVGYTKDKIGITDGNWSSQASALTSKNNTVLGFEFITSPTTEYIKWYDTNSTNLNEQIMLTEGPQETPYEPYQEHIVTIPLNGNEIAGTDSAHKDILLVDSDGHCYLQKNTRWLELAIADMNNSENYPGWKNQLQLKDDYPNVSASAYLLGISFMSNITKNNSLVRINSMNANAIIYLEKTLTNLNQTQWKEQYPDLVFKLLYALQTPDIIDLNYDVDIRLFQGVNNISNSDDMDMEIKYVRNTQQYIESLETRIAVLETN